MGGINSGSGCSEAPYWDKAFFKSRPNSLRVGISAKVNVLALDATLRGCDTPAFGLGLLYIQSRGIDVLFGP